MGRAAVNAMMRKEKTLYSPAATMSLMGGCYALGACADNFYKQAAVLLAAAAAMTGVQSLATVLFSLPFVLFSAWAGWLADRAPKKNIIVAAKTLELCAMLAGGWFLIEVNWPGILAVMFLMAAQSTLFSPAINGAIPEYFAAAEVPRVNAVIKAVSTAAILAGMALAGFCLDARPAFLSGFAAAGRDAQTTGRMAVALVLVLISLVGIGLALLLRRSPPPQGPKAAFPLAGPLASLRQAIELRTDPALFLVLLADCWFYGIAVIAVISIANLAVGLGYGNSAAGALAAVLMVGVAAGSLLAGRGSAQDWRKRLVPSGCGMALMLLLCGLAPLFSGHIRVVWLGVCLFCCGLCGGLYLIPLESFIQVRPAAHEKGKVIAVSNFMSFSAMALFGAAFQIIGLLPPAATFLIYGLGTLAFILVYAAPRIRRLPDAGLAEQAVSPLGLVLRCALGLRYRLTVKGLEDIPARRAVAEQAPQPGLNATAWAAQADRQTAATSAPQPGILFLCNHPSYIDPPLIWAELAGLWPRPLADTLQMSGPMQRLAGRIVRAITIPDPGRDGKKSAALVRRALEACAAALNRGENVLLFPAGRASRDGAERLGANSAVFRLMQAAPGIRVVLARISGLWGSSFSFAYGNKPAFMRCLGQGALTLLAGGIFFTPRRDVLMEFAELEGLPRNADKQALNAYLEDWFRAAQGPPRRVPRFFWQTRTAD